MKKLLLLLFIPIVCFGQDIETKEYYDNGQKIIEKTWQDNSQIKTLIEIMSDNGSSYKYFINEKGIEVGANFYVIRDYGKYFKVELSVINNSKDRLDFLEKDIYVSVNGKVKNKEKYYAIPFNEYNSEVTKRQNLNEFLTGFSHGVSNVKRNGKEITVTANDKKGVSIEFKGDYCLVSVGRKPHTKGLNLEAIGVQLNEKGQVEVNEFLQTSINNIYAIGDVVRGSMLAHKAEEEGVMVAEFIAGQKPHIDYNLIPNVIYTWHEVASVGKTEEQLKEEGLNYKTGQFPMRALGRARASMDTDGFVKILADMETDEVLGVHMIGARAADLIAEAVTAMEFRASAEDIARMSHSHPTYAEAIKEAALAATENRALHI